MSRQKTPRPLLREKIEELRVRFNERRRTYGLSYSAMAEPCGVHRTTLTRFAQGYDVDVYTMEQIESWLNDTAYWDAMNIVIMR